MEAIMQNKRNADESVAILQRLMWWSTAVDDLASCPIEDIQFNAGQISFFIDARRCKNQVLPGFVTAAERVRHMSLAEQHDLVLYVVRLHKEQFACAAR